GAGTRGDLAEGQVDPRAHRPRGTRQRVFPVALGGPAHEQQAARLQPERQLPAWIVAPAQDEVAHRAQAQRGDQRLRPQFRLVVAVPAHGVAAVAVEVGQHAVEWPAQLVLQAAPQGLQRRGPGPRYEAAARIAVDRVRVADPAAEPGGIDLTPEQADP